MTGPTDCTETERMMAQVGQYASPRTLHGVRLECHSCDWCSRLAPEEQREFEGVQRIH